MDVLNVAALNVAAECCWSNLQQNQATHLVEHMARLTNTADYNNKATRPVLAQRVI